MGRKILVWSPYAQWAYHRALEAFFVHGLRRRGHEVTVLSCDAAFNECDTVRWRAMGLDARPADACANCQREVQAGWDQLSVDFGWLGPFIPDGVRAEADRWSATLAPEELHDATWAGQPVGRWSLSSAFFHFRMSVPEPENPDVVENWQRHIANTVVAWEALQRVFDHHQPDVLVTFNGRFFSNVVAIEIARQRGIRVVTHEHGYRRETALVVPDAPIHTLERFERVWRDWHDVPLTEAQLHETWQVLTDRRYGKGQPFRPFSPPASDAATMRAALGLDARPLVVCFTSSDDEFAAFPERAEGPFPASLDWLPATVQAARDNPHLQWVIRMHPNLVRNGGNRQAVAHAEALVPDLPNNCRLVMPAEDVSSYTLADMASAVVIYQSTMGLEQACLGRRVVSVARGWYGDTDFVLSVPTPADYLRVVEQAVAMPPSLRVAQQAWRFLWHVWHESAIPTQPWLTMGGDAGGQASDPADPRLDGDPHLKRMLDLIDAGTPLQAPPRPEDRGQRSLIEEHRILQSVPPLAQAPDAPRGNDYRSLCLQAEQAEEAGQIRIASRAWMGASSRAPHAAEPWLGLGRCLRRMGKAAEAAEALQRAAHRAPTDGRAWAELAVLVDHAEGREKARRIAHMAARRGAEHPVLQALLSEPESP